MHGPPQFATNWYSGVWLSFCLPSCCSSTSLSCLTSILGSRAYLSTTAEAWKHFWAGVRACFVYKQQQTNMFLSTIVQFWEIQQMQWFLIFSQDHFFLQWLGCRCVFWGLTSIACVSRDRWKSGCQNRHVKNFS